MTCSISYNHLGQTVVRQCGVVLVEVRPQPRRQLVEAIHLPQSVLLRVLGGGISGSRSILGERFQSNVVLGTGLTQASVGTHDHTDVCREETGQVRVGVAYINDDQLSVTTFPEAVSMAVENAQFVDASRDTTKSLTDVAWRGGWRST